METSGRLETNREYESYFWVEWKQSSQDIPNNKTLIAWSCGVYCGHNFFVNAIRMSAVSINGSQVYSGGTYSDFEIGDHTIADGTLQISHNTDGTMTFSVASFTGWLYKNHNYSSNGGSFSLTPIPRQAKITSATNFTDVDNPSISFSNPGEFPMKVWIEPNPVGDRLCVREDIHNTGSYTWVLTDEERNALRNKCSGNSCTIRLGLNSYVGDVEYADYRDVTYTMTENAATNPSVSMTVSLDNRSLPSQFAEMYIQSKSRVSVSLTATGKFGASITSYSAQVDGKKYSSDYFTSDPIQGSGSVVISGTAKDSRGFIGSADTSINVVEYSKPLVVPISNENAILCYRSDGNGNRVGNSTSVWIKAKRSYYNLSQKNTCTLRWRRKLVTEAWNDAKHTWSNLIAGSSTSTDVYNALLSDVVFDLKDSYTIQIQAIDDIGEYDTKTLEVPTQDVALHLGRGGKNVAVGTYCDYTEDYTFYSEWKAIFDKDVVIHGNLSIDGKTLEEYIKSVINGGG